MESSMRKTDNLFDAMFSEFTYTGSSFDRLRITDANEFDINVVLKLPVRRDKIILETSTDYASHSNFAILRVDNSKGDAVVNNLDSSLRNKFLKFLDNEGNVVPEFVLRWMQSVIEKACNSLGMNNYQFSKSASGPAKTLKFTPPNANYTIDVDLVAVFRFEHGQWINYNSDFQNDIVEGVPEYRQRMYLVPKPHVKLQSYMWRKHFPDVERELIYGIGMRAVKPVIRIMKLLRDNCQWKNVASYYLKTLVMIEVVNTDDPGYWDDSRTPYLVFTMMRQLRDYFQKGFLPHLLYRNVNLFEGLHPDELKNQYFHLSRIYNKCLTDIEMIETFFIPPREPEEEQVAQKSYCSLL